MIIDSFGCGFEPTLCFECEAMPIEPVRTQCNKFENINKVFDLIDGKRTLTEIGVKLGLTNKIVSNCIYKLRGKLIKVGSRNQSTIYKRKKHARRRIDL